jgi:hypothetical protein
VDNARSVDSDHVADAVFDEQPGTRDAGGTHAEEDDAHVLEALPDHVSRVDQRSQCHDGSPMLVVVEDGDVELVTEAALDLEAHRSRDVFEIDPTEPGRDRASNGDELIGGTGARTDGVGVDVGELFEEHGLAFHNRKRRLRADVAKTEHRRSVRQHGDRVLLDREIPYALGVVCDGSRHTADAGRIRHREVVSCPQRELPRHRDLASGVHLERPVRDRTHLDALDPGCCLHDLLAVRLVPRFNGQVANDDASTVFDQVNRTQIAAGAADRCGEPAESAGDVFEVDTQSESVASGRSQGWHILRS